MNPAVYAQKYLHTVHRVHHTMGNRYGFRSGICVLCKQVVFTTARTQRPIERFWRTWTIVIHETP